MLKEILQKEILPLTKTIEALAVPPAIETTGLLPKKYRSFCLPQTIETLMDVWAETDPVEGDPVKGDPVEGDPAKGDPVEGILYEDSWVRCPV